MDFKVRAEERSFPNIMKQTFYRSVSTVKMVYDSLIGLVTGRFGMEAVSGPIGVAETVGTAAKTDYLSFIYIVSILTINLGVVNLLPFPALDGGRALMLIVEGIRRKPIDRNIEGYINFVGIVILFAFMIFVSFKDVFKLIFR
jgi:regulator of sigma E protease